jgi:uncharacterized protein (DUF1330 family)
VDRGSIVSSGVTLGFYGNARDDALERVKAFEDDVLSLLSDHGAKLLFRGRRQEGQSQELPAEFHVIWFPSEQTFDKYLSDPRRLEFLHAHGEVFTTKTVVRLDPVRNPVG